MFNRNKFTDEELRDFERYEEYERRKNERIVKGAGSFIYRFFVYCFIWFTGYLLTYTILIGALKMGEVISAIIGMILPVIVIRKVEYIKENPFKSLVLTAFLLFISMIAFDVR